MIVVLWTKCQRLISSFSIMHTDSMQQNFQRGYFFKFCRRSHTEQLHDFLGFWYKNGKFEASYFSFKTTKIVFYTLPKYFKLPLGPPPLKLNLIWGSFYKKNWLMPLESRFWDYRIKMISHNKMMMNQSSFDHFFWSSLYLAFKQIRILQWKRWNVLNWNLWNKLKCQLLL